MYFPRFLAVLLATLAAAPGAFAQSAPTLEERLSEAQFKAFGLDKLTPEELQGLNAWLQGDVASRVAAAAPAGDRDYARGFKPKDSERVQIKAQLVGTFRGWSGNTIFKLDNGQEWQQAEGGSYNAQTVENAEVTIKPKAFGNWLLVVEQCQCRVGVRRIK
ncbi:MAG TPA: hypothetical protein PKO41_09615 [Dokdonella sp.]|uniref:hypothetical protein n=1 Tax=Dokdonella sp. TaxID=2291710 RepID=UPI0025B82CA5|nr:hypothetical protein [Dokdonella sp.]MBX3690629.1 hypothetical protein [Dokdonella sp.]MCW5567626.1 hypothetical protein [Dokdonella sp.]HNR92670.1 hypothetical protein [Dokdonella sp.]